jgi:replicative DNA helicase
MQTRANNRTAVKSNWADNAMAKIPPQAIELEEAVLGALMLEKEALHDIVDILKPESFYKEAHQRIYEAILALFLKSEPVDLHTVYNQLRTMGYLELAGGSTYLAQLTAKINSAANVEYHARIVSEMAMKRELIGMGNELIRDAFDQTTDIFMLLDKTEQTLFNISEANIRKNYADVRSIMSNAIKELEARKNHTDGLTGVASGFTELDRVTSGWQKSDLVILAARPGMGKCLGKGTKVLMYDGLLKNVEDVMSGDLLMGADSKPRKVLSIGRGREQMYWIRQNKGIDYRVNESHLLSLKRSRNEGKHQKGEILTISVKDFLEKSKKFRSNYKGYKTAVDFAEKKVPIEAYFLGLWLGDGNSGNVKITNQDAEVIEYLEKYAFFLGLQLSISQQAQKTPQYSITKGSRGKQLFFSVQQQLRNLVLINNKHIPDLYLINSTSKRLELLAGLIDSDGHYERESNSYEITQKNKNLAEQIKFLADSLGFRTSIRNKKATLLSRNYEAEVFRVRLFGDVDKIPVKIARKKAHQWKSKVDWRVTGLKIEADIIDDYYGFELDGDGLFLLEDMTVTHNTAFVISALRNAAVQFNKAVAIFSLEMSSLQLVNRLIAAEAEIDSNKLKTGKLADEEWRQIVQRTAPLTEAPIFIDDTPALSILELRAKARRLKAQSDIQLIIIDYLQLMSGDSMTKGASGNREQEIASISRALKQLAKELDIPVIALSQLSRAVETRGGDKRPQLSDLRESGSIEQDADMVIFLYRPEYYGITEDAEGRPTADTAEVIIAKHRNGSLETVLLKFIGRFTKFTSLEDSGSGFSNNSFASSTDSNFSTPNSNSEMITLGSKINLTPNTSFQSNGNDEVPF